MHVCLGINLIVFTEIYFQVNMRRLLMEFLHPTPRYKQKDDYIKVNTFYSLTPQLVNNINIAN